MKRLVLLGGGHAHVHVLAQLAEWPLAGWDVRLVSPHRRQIYSGMLPGWIAGHYPIEACSIRLDAMAQRAGAALHETAGLGLDLEAGTVQCADGDPVCFDALSIDTGPMPALQHLPGGAEHALPVRPIEQFIAAWPDLVDRILGQCRRFELVILGAGAAGIELAFAIQRRAAIEGWSHLFVTVLGSDELPLPGAPAAARRHAVRLLARRGIAWKAGSRASRIDAQRIHIDVGPPLPFDACIVSTGAAAPGWPAASGLDTGARGFIRVNPSLQSTSHPASLLPATWRRMPTPARSPASSLCVRGRCLRETCARSAKAVPLRRGNPRRVPSTSSARATATRWPPGADGRGAVTGPGDGRTTSTGSSCGGSAPLHRTPRTTAAPHNTQDGGVCPATRTIVDDQEESR